MSLYLKQSPDLTEESLNSIIRSLKTRTAAPASASATTGVLTLANSEMLTDEQTERINAKKWLIA